MSQNLLDQLADVEIPPKPAEFSRQVHQRLNGRLLVVQLAEVAVRGLPYAIFHFSRALTGALLFSLAGRFHKGGEGHAKRDDNDRD